MSRGHTPQESIMGCPNFVLQAGYGHWMKAHVRPYQKRWGSSTTASRRGLGPTSLNRSTEPCDGTKPGARLSSPGGPSMATYTSWERFLRSMGVSFTKELLRKAVAFVDHKPWSAARPTEERRWGRAFFRPNLPSPSPTWSRSAHNLGGAGIPAQELPFAMIDQAVPTAHENPIHPLNHTPLSR